MNATAMIYVDLESCHVETSHAPVSSDSIILLTAGNDSQNDRIARPRNGTAQLDQMSISFIAPTCQIHFHQNQQWGRI